MPCIYPTGAECLIKFPIVRRVEFPLFQLSAVSAQTMSLPSYLDYSYSSTSLSCIVSVIKLRFGH